MRAFARSVVVPKPYLDLCSKEILTMEYFKGPKLVDGAREKGRQYAALIGKTFEELEAEFKADIAKNGMPPPYNGPSSLTLELYRKWIMTKDAFMNAPIVVANAFISGWKLLSGWAIKPFNPFASFIPLNSSFIMSSLLEAHGHQLLVDGFFNAGNSKNLI
jgi:aarF domain-containing kinase